MVKRYSLMGPFFKKQINEMALGPYSQHFMLFVTYEWAQKARELHYTRLEELAKVKHSSFMGPFLRNEENEV